MTDKERTRIVNNMCMTWRHDYGLLSDKDQKSLFKEMAQIFDNDIYRELDKKDIEIHELKSHIDNIQSAYQNMQEMF